MLSVPCLVCKKCGEPMPLANPKGRRAPYGEPPWPDDKPRNFLCPHCKRVFEYFARDVRDKLLDNDALGDFRKGYGVVSVEVPCDAPGCKERVKIEIPTPFGADAVAVARVSLPDAVAHGGRCANGHSKYGPCDSDFVNEASFDEEWESVAR